MARIEGQVWLCGKRLPVARLDGGRSLAEVRGDRLLVRGPEEGARRAIGRWYRREARRILGQVVDREARRLGLAYDRISIRDQRTRWASCSRRGSLSFSWRLLLAPLEVLEYVVVHELCHLREPNHSKAFWQLVDAARPGWQAQARWLREHGRELHALEPVAERLGSSG